MGDNRGEMTTPIFVVDAFAERLFAGNPAAVCPLQGWLEDSLLQAIAAENNLSETAFVVERPPGDSGTPEYDLRWFTPATEVDLCGHATVAAAHVVCTELTDGAERVVFHSRSGPLPVTRAGSFYTLDFPTKSLTPCDAPAAVVDGIGVSPVEVWATGRDYLVLLDSADEVAGLAPDMRALARADGPVIATAVGSEPGTDFVSRFFAPGFGVDEDPVTGSAHCALVPYWAERLGKSELVGRQISSRGGVVYCQLVGERTHIRGQAVSYLRGSIEV